MQATKMPITTAEGGRDGDALEDVDQFFDQSIIKDQMELAVRMAEMTRATSEWHRRMTAENLSQSGYVVGLTKYSIGQKAFIYKWLNSEKRLISLLAVFFLPKKTN